MTPHPVEGRQCTATAKSTGDRCQKPPIRGGSVCGSHGGGAPAVRAAAAKRVQEAEAAALVGSIWNPDAAPVMNPVEALQKLAGQLQHAADTLGARLDVVDLDGPAAIAWAKVLRELRQSLEGMERLGLQQKSVALSEQTGALLAWAVRTILDRLDVSDQQRVLAGSVVPGVFRELAASGGHVPGAAREDGS